MATATSTHRRWVTAGVATASAGVFVALALVNVGRAYSYDEAVTVGYFVRLENPVEALTSQRVFNNQPLLTAFNWLVWQLGGTTEALQRVPAIGAGAILVAVVTVWSTRRHGLLPGLVGSAFLVFNPLMIEVARQARGYSLAALFVLLATLRVVDNERGLGRLYSVFVAAALLSHLYAGIVVVAHGIGLAGSARERFREWEVRTGLGVILAAPIYLAMAPSMLSSAGGRGRIFAEEFPLDLSRALFGSLLGSAAVLLLLAWMLFRASQLVQVMTATVAVGVAGVWLVVQPHDLYPRFLVWTAPLLACAFAALGRRHTLAVPLLTAVITASFLPAIGPVLDERPSTHVVAAAFTELDEEFERTCIVGFFGESLTVYLSEEPPGGWRHDGCDAVLYRTHDADAVASTFGSRWSVTPDTCAAVREPIAVSSSSRDTEC